MSDDFQTRDEEENEEVGLGGSTGGGMLGGGTATDVAEGRSAFHTDDEASDDADEETADLTGSGISGKSSGTPSRATAIAHDPANSTGTTDAGLSTEGESRSGTGGLISGGLPGEGNKS